MYFAYPHEAILHNTINYVHFLHVRLPALKASCGLPTVPLRSTGRSR